MVWVPQINISMRCAAVEWRRDGGMMDAQDRLWFGEYRGDRIAMFDTKTEQFKEWKVPPRWSAPYDVFFDKNEEAWTGSMITGQVTRLNTQSGELV